MVSSGQQMSGVGKWAAIWTDLGPIAHWRSDVETWGGGAEGESKERSEPGPRAAGCGQEACFNRNRLFPTDKQRQKVACTPSPSLATPPFRCHGTSGYLVRYPQIRTAQAVEEVPGWCDDWALGVGGDRRRRCAAQGGGEG